MKLAFCFLIYDIIHLEVLWYTFFNNISKDKYNIYIHYKINTPLQYFENCKIKSIDTNYAHISIVKAQNVLLEEAIKDPSNTSFIFLSGNCVPFKSFNYIYNMINKDVSYFNYSYQNWCFPRCNKTLNFIDKKYIQKASQWCILNRKHVNVLLENREYLEWFNYDETVPDEHCYITYLFYKGLTNELLVTMNESNCASTFTNWEGNKYKYPSDRGLKNYFKVSFEEIMYLVNSPCFFGRKFYITCINDFNNKSYLDSIQK